MHLRLLINSLFINEIVFKCHFPFNVSVYKGRDTSPRKQFAGETHHEEDPWHRQEYFRQKRQFRPIAGIQKTISLLV